MGITKFSASLIAKYVLKEKINSVVELGSQNCYFDPSEKYPPFASDYYKSIGIKEYVAIDLGGDNGAFQLDLAYPIDVSKINSKQFDLVTDFGTGEHVVQMQEYESVAFHDGHINSIYPKGEVENIELGYYNCWLNKHNLCKIGGLIISENPKTGHWPDHGYSYVDMAFFIRLATLAGYESLELGEHAAMGNFESGINIYSVLRKKFDSFIPFEKFMTLNVYKK